VLRINTTSVVYVQTQNIRRVGYEWVGGVGVECGV